MNFKATPQTPAQNLTSQQHLTHDQLCDVLLHDDLDVHALHGDAALSPVTADNLVDCQEHLRDCLICAAELETMRLSVARFQIFSDAIVDRQLTRRPLPSSFNPLHGSHSRGHAVPALLWATAAVLVAALTPLNLFHLRPNPLLKAADVQQAVSSDATLPASSESDAALLDDINQHLSAAVPTPMQPLESPVFAETSSAQEANGSRAETN